jgi:hypothetical protein
LLRFEAQLAEERAKAAAVRAENGVLRKKADASAEAAAGAKRLAADNAAQRDALQQVAAQCHHNTFWHASYQLLQM